MKKLLLICLLFIFASCGGKNNGTIETKKTSDQSPIEESLSVEEKKFVDKLLKLKTITQKALLKEILLIEDLKGNSLERLDNYLNIDCTITQGLCQIENKETL